MTRQIVVLTLVLVALVGFAFAADAPTGSPATAPAAGASSPTASSSPTATPSTSPAPGPDSPTSASTPSISLAPDAETPGQAPSPFAAGPGKNAAEADYDDR